MRSCIPFTVIAIATSIIFAACSDVDRLNPNDPLQDVSTRLLKPQPSPAHPANPAITYRSWGMNHGLYTTGVFVMDADGNNQTMLYSDRNGWEIIFPKWSGNGNKICFQQYPGDVYTLDVSLVNGVPTASNVTRILTHTSNPLFGYYRPVWSPTANEIAVITSSGPAPQRILVVPSAGGTPSTLYTCLSSDYGVDSPCYSPDGTKIGFLLKKEVTGERWMMVIERSTGNVLKSISLDPAYSVSWMDWSRGSGSNTVIFSRNPVGGGQSNIFTMDINVPTTPTQVVSNGTDPSWSPNDTQFSYYNSQGIWVRSLGNNTSTLISTASDKPHPNWKR